jgi:hypothetical protein
MTRSNICLEIFKIQISNLQSIKHSFTEIHDTDLSSDYKAMQTAPTDCLAGALIRKNT